MSSFKRAHLSAVQDPRLPFFVKQAVWEMDQYSIQIDVERAFSGPGSRTACTSFLGD